MDAVIIGAMTKETPIENYYRHQLLSAFLDKYCPAETLQVTGNNGEFLESAVMLVNLPLTEDQKWDFINIARLFTQDYILLVENDKAYEISCKSGTPKYIGVWWDIDDPSCPGTVIDAIQDGYFTQVQNTGQTWGIQTPEMAKEWTERLQGIARINQPDDNLLYPSKLERDAHLARTYPYSN